MRIFLCIFIFSWTALEAEDKASVILVTGAPGTEEYKKTFNEWSAQWEEAAGKGEAKFSEAVHTEEKSQKETLAQLIKAEVNESKSPLWLVSSMTARISPGLLWSGIITSIVRPCGVATGTLSPSTSPCCTVYSPCDAISC